MRLKRCDAEVLDFFNINFCSLAKILSCVLQALSKLAIGTPCARVLLGAHVPGIDAGPNVRVAAAQSIQRSSSWAMMHAQLNEVYACGSCCFVLEVDAEQAHKCLQAPSLKL